MQEEEDLGSIGVSFCKGEEVEVVVAYVKELREPRQPCRTALSPRPKCPASIGEPSLLNVRLCPHRRNMVERRSFLLRLRKGGWGISRRQTWVYLLYNFGQEGSRVPCQSFSITGHRLFGVKLALPLRSRKKTAEAMAAVGSLKG